MRVIGGRKKAQVMKAINLADKLAMFSGYWQPRVVGSFNGHDLGHDLMVVKVKGEFVWRKHEDTDDFFLVLAGHMIIQLHDGNVRVGPGEVFVVPKGVEHRPVAEDEAHVLLIEPCGTPNTGDAATDEAVTVHDILHERDGAEWRQCVSAYCKLRLPPDWVSLALEANGFQVVREQGVAGLVRLVANRPL